MIRITLKIIISWIFLVNQTTWAQEIKKKTPDSNQDLTFNGARISLYDANKDSTAKLEITGYVDTYYALYSDSASSNSFQKFPTVSPRNNSFGLNIAQVSARYQGENFRGVMTVFIGDIPNCSWSPKLNLIQEANVGFKLGKKIWLDAGYFRTHLGLESIQPRENMTLSMSTTNFFEPYYLSGAKLTYELDDKLTLQVNVFNGFNSFVDNNSNKAIGLSMVYLPNDKLSITYSNLLSEETPGSQKGNKTRLYNNVFAVYKNQRFTIGAEVNYGIQNHTVLIGNDHQASMFSALLAAKYRITHQWASYIRGEYFSDPDEMLTGPILNENLELLGLKIGGFTSGIEFKPIPNAYVRIEGRVLDTRKDEQLFMLNGQPSNNRYEFLSGIGLWF